MQISDLFNLILLFLGFGLIAGAFPAEPTRQLGKAYISDDGKVVADSEVFPYTYTLDSSAPLLSTHDELLARADVYKKVVRVERLNGTLMLISSAYQQVGTLTGQIATDVEAVYPDQKAIAKARVTVHEKLALQNSTSAASNAISERDLSGGILEKRKFCGPCIITWFCDTSGGWKNVPQCDRHICVLLFCVGT